MITLNGMIYNGIPYTAMEYISDIIESWIVVHSDTSLTYITMVFLNGITMIYNGI